MSEAVCASCGGEMQVIIVYTNPPQTCYRCAKCGRHVDEPNKPKPVVK